MKLTHFLTIAVFATIKKDLNMYIFKNIRYHLDSNTNQTPSLTLILTLDPLDQWEACGRMTSQMPSLHQKDCHLPKADMLGIIKVSGVLHNLPQLSNFSYKIKTKTK
jgi:hypothetical protein